MNKQRRRTNRKGIRATQSKRQAARRLLTEQLEDRRLLTAFDGYNPYHNYIYSEDVTKDFQLTPRDALAVIRELNANGIRDLSDDDGDWEATGGKVDTNGDGYLSPADVLGVIKALNDGEGEETQKFVEVALVVLDSTGTPLPDGARIKSGETFQLQVQTRHLTEVDNVVFTMHTDISYDSVLLNKDGTIHDDLDPVYTNNPADPDALTELFTIGGLDPSQFLDPVVDGAVNDPAATTKVFIGNSALSDEDDAYNGFSIRFTDGDLKGTDRTIIDYDGATRTIMLDDALSAAPDDGTPFEILVFYSLLRPVESEVADPAASTTVFIGDSDLSDEDDAYNGFTIKFTRGALAGAEGTIADYDGATRTITLAEALSSAPVDEARFEISGFHRGYWKPSEFYPLFPYASPWRWLDGGGWTDHDGNLTQEGKQDQIDEVGGTAAVGLGDLPDWGDDLTPVMTGTLEANLQFDHSGKVTFQSNPVDDSGFDILLYDPVGVGDPVPVDNIEFGDVTIEIYWPVYARPDVVSTLEDTEFSVSVNKTPNHPLLENDDLDVSSTGPLTIIDRTDGSFGTTKIENGQLIYTPGPPEHVNSDITGPDTFTYTIQDGDGNTDTATVTITVTPVNDAPTLTSFAAVVDTTNEDTQVEITFAELAAQGDEADVDGTVDAFVVKNVASGTLKIGTSAGTATDWAAGTNDTIDATHHAYWTPALDAKGTQDALAVVVRDNLGAEQVTGDVTAQVSVTPVNDPPTLTSFAAVVDTTNEDTQVEITFAELAAQGDEADVDGTVDAFVVQNVASGTLKIGTSAGTATDWAAGTNDTIDATNNAYWKPALDANGTQNAFAVVVRDNLSAESTGDVTAQVFVTPVNDPPIPSEVTDFVARERLLPADEASEFYVLEGTPTLREALPGPDTADDEQGQLLKIHPVIVTSPTLGTLDISADGTFFIYTPNVGNLGGQTDFFQYRIQDNGGGDDTSVVADGSILIDPAVRPYAIDDPADTMEDNDVDIDVLFNDLPNLDDNDDPIEYTRFELVVSVEQDGTIIGSDTLILPNVGTVTIVDQGTSTTSDDVINFDPAPDFFTTGQPVTFQYVIDDDVVEDSVASEPSIATVRVTVNSDNDAPIAEDDFRVEGDDQIREDTPTVILSLGNDVAGPANETEDIFLDTDASFASAKGGTVEKILGETQFRYTPPANYWGTDSFTYTIRDAFGAVSNEATVHIDIYNVNDKPTAIHTTFERDEDSSELLNVMIDDFNGEPNSNDGLNDFRKLVLGGLGTPSKGGSVEIEGDEVRYTPKKDFFGTETFTYTIEDSEGLTDVGLTTVMVRNVNDAPWVKDEDGSATDQAILLALKDGDPIEFAVLSNDTDGPPGPPSEGEEITIKELIGENGIPASSVKTPHGTVEISADQKHVIYEPDPGFVTTNGDYDSFQYVVQDESGGETTGLALVDVIDAVPSDISGTVYIDANHDGEEQADELKLAGVEVYLTGTNIRGVTINEMAVTDAEGKFTFAGILPTDPEDTVGYSLAAQTPKHMNDGLEAIVQEYDDENYDSGDIHNDLFSGIMLGVWGSDGRATENYSFGEAGLMSTHIKLTQYLASYQRGVLLGGSGTGDTYWYSIMEGWDGVEKMEFKFDYVDANDTKNEGLSKASLTIWDADGNHETQDLNYYTHYDFSGNPKTGNGCVIFLKGSAASMGFQLLSDNGDAEGEPEWSMEGEQLEMLAAAQFRKGVDAVFGDGDWA